MQNPETGDVVLSLRGLSIDFVTARGTANAVEGVDIDVRRGEKIGIVGESGSGKSIVCKAVLKLLPETAKVSGQALYGGQNLLTRSDREMYGVRGKEIAMVFQEPMTSLNPLFTIGDQLVETITLHQKLSRGAARERALEMLRLVNIPQPEQRLRQYPFEMSGGMRQRVMIAIALSCTPAVLIADEPTTALDVTIQAQILELINRLNSELDTALILITHDLGVIAETVERVVVMYAGHTVEFAPVSAIFNDPLHPYTQGLLKAVPRIESTAETLDSIPGVMPSIHEMPEGCRFAPRCPHARDLCRQPPPLLVRDARKVRCWIYSDQWEQTDA